MPGRADGSRLAHQPQRQRGCDQVADDRDQPDQAVDPVADVGARNNKGDIQKPRYRIEPRQPLLAAEIGERIGAGICEIEAEAAAPGTESPAKYLLRDFAPLLVD